MIYKADTLPSFHDDELPNVQAAVSFFKNGDYRSDKYGLIYSSGIAVTWPGAVGWFFGHSMFASRLACTFFSWIFSLLLGFYFFRRNNFTAIDSIAAVVCLWGITITSPLALPYWFGFMYNLGELNTLLLIGFGLFLLAKRPLLSSFILSVAFWHGKFIYFPLIWAILLGDIFSQKLPAKEKVSRILLYVVIFLLPLLMWIAWLFLKLNISGLKEWLADEFSWFTYAGSMHSHLSPVELSLNALKERFNSPKLEWSGYTLGTKFKDLLFSFGAILITFISFVAARKEIIKISNREKWLNIMAIATIGFYCVFYFLINPFMWQRYFLPTLYIGFFLFVFWGSKWAKVASFNLRPIFYALVIFLIILQGVSSAKHPILQSQPTYARSWTNLYVGK